MSLIKLAYTLKELEKVRIELTKPELDEVFKQKAVWHHGLNGEETSAVWKALDVKSALKKAGRHKAPVPEFIYVTNTHRAMSTSKTLKGIIHKYHSFIKGTA